MRTTFVLLFALLCTLPLRAEVYRSSNLGWTADQNVTGAFGKLLKDGPLGPGDELVLDHTYRISGHHILPDNITLSAVKGAGFDVTDAVEPKNNRPLLELGNHNTLRNLTITYLDTPKLGPTGEERGVTFTSRQGIHAYGKRNIRIENCRLTGSIGHQLKLVECTKVNVTGTHIAGGHWSVYLVGVRDLNFSQCLIEKCQGDAIKTGGGAKRAGGATRDVLVENCVFQDNLRDGIDTTGGFNNSVVRNCIFRRMGVSGMDLKSHYESRKGDIDELAPENVGIVIEDCLFHDMPNAIVLTTMDGGRRRGPGKEMLTADNVKKYAPHDIEMRNCVVGHAEKPLRPKREGGYGVNYPRQQGEGEHMRMIFLKDAYDIRYKDARLFGDRIMPYVVDSIGGSRALSQEAADALDHSITGNVLDEPAPAIEAGVTDVSFDCGPRTLKGNE